MRRIATALAVVVVVAFLVRVDPATRRVAPSPSPEPTPLDEDGDEGHRGPWPSQVTGSVLVLVDDHAVTFVDLDAGRIRTRPLALLSAGDPPLRVAERAGALVLWGRGDVHVASPDRLEDARLLAERSVFVPSALPDRVWTSPPGAEVMVLEERTIGGDTVATVPAPPGTTGLAAALADALVLDRGDGVAVWDPVEGKLLHELPGAVPLAGAGDRLAWCGDPCTRIRVLDVATGVEREWTRAAREPVRVAFTPDGLRLAVADGTALAVSGSGTRFLPLRTARLGVDAQLVALAWSPDASLVLAVSAGGHLLVHRPDDGWTEVLDLRLPRPNGLAVIAGDLAS